VTDHRVICADCLGPDGLASLPDKSVDHVITDPPYSEKVHSSQRRGYIAHEEGTGRSTFNRACELGFEAMTEDVMRGVAAHVARVARRWSLVFCDAELIAAWRSALGDAGLEAVRVGAWIKEGSTPQFTGDRPAPGWEAIVIAHPPGRKHWNGGGRHGVWSEPIVLNRGGNDPRFHTTQKPLPLMEALVRDFTDPGDLVCDPFAGSGTTGVACKRLGRRFIGFERDAKYHAIAQKRIDGAREQRQLFAERAPKPVQASLSMAEEGT
jgi:DNA modification methylase